MTLEEFREELINDIKSESLIDSEYPAEIFIDYCNKSIKLFFSNNRTNFYFFT